MSLQSEEIPDLQILYRYAKRAAFPIGQDEIPASIFNDPELSCDWALYQKNPESSYHISEGKEIIVEITVCDDIRNPKNPKRGNPEPPWKQDIFHNPMEAIGSHPANFSHSLIKGVKKKVVTDALISSSIFRNKDRLL
ncbi:MAG: hypothetical protein ABI315_10280 [Bacteroidia bacterium]